MHFNKKWWVLTSGAKLLLLCTSIKSSAYKERFGSTSYNPPLFIEVHKRRSLAPLVKTHHFLLKCMKGEAWFH
jgi:hypothetical protein